MALPDLTTPDRAPDAVVVQPGTIVARPRPRSRPAAPRGPGQADRRRHVRRRPRLPGRLVRRDDPLDRRARDASSALDLDPAFDWSTVVVVTAADIPGENIVSSIKADQPILVPVGGEIHHHAEPLALIAAPDRATLRAARRARHGPDRAAARRSSTRSRPTTCSPRTSIGARRRRTPRFAAADLVLEGEYRVGHQEQLYIENNAMIAVPRPTDGGVTVHGSLQCPYYVHTALKRGLGARRTTQARVVQAETGGGFGGKEEYPSVIALHAALLARQGAAAGPDDLRPPRGHRGDDQAPPGDRPPPDRA